MVANDASGKNGTKVQVGKYYTPAANAGKFILFTVIPVSNNNTSGATYTLSSSVPLGDTPPSILHSSAISSLCLERCTIRG